MAALGCSADLFGGSGQSGNNQGPGGGDPIGGPGKTSASLCASLPPGTLGVTPIRQLTRDEYANSVRDLTGLDANVGSYPQIVDDGFDNDVSLLSVDPELAQYLQLQGETLAEQVLADAEAKLRVTGCEAIDEDCVRSFIESFGQRVLRRPLSTDEQEAYFSLYGWGAERGGAERGVKLVLQALLQDPHFIHRVEGAEAGPTTEFELATRLSYFLWKSTPDAELLSAAERGELNDPAALEAQARRLLADPRARQTVGDFHAQWLDYTAVQGAIKDPEVYPDFSQELMTDLMTETSQLIDHVVWSGEASFAELLSADYSFMNGRVAQHYGVAGVEGDEFQRVDLGDSPRRGVLTHASFLASRSTAEATHPIQRGVYVRERILCQHLPPPPPTAPTTVPNVDYDKTRREQFDQITSAAECNTCHSLINPAGYMFENYDSVGVYRETDNGKAVDASAELINAGSLEGGYDDASQFLQAAAVSAEAEACAVEHWFSFSQGRAIHKDDACVLAELQELFSSSGGDVQELIVQIVLSKAFSSRNPQEAP